MFRCNNCDHEFDEPKEITTSMEDYYGVSSEFPNSTPCVLQMCPYCDSEDFEEIEEDD